MTAVTSQRFKNTNPSTTNNGSYKKHTNFEADSMDNDIFEKDSIAKNDG